MKEHGCSKLALGHHFDDAVETVLMMSLVFEGRLNCFKPGDLHVPRGRDADPPASVHQASGSVVISPDSSSCPS